MVLAMVPDIGFDGRLKEEGSWWTGHRRLLLEVKRELFSGV